MHENELFYVEVTQKNLTGSGGDKMQRRKDIRLSTMILLIIMPASVAANDIVPVTKQTGIPNKFETVRIYVNAWLEKLSPDMLLITSFPCKTA